MTELGKTFTDIAHLVRHRYFTIDTNKMVTGYTLYEVYDYEVAEYERDKSKLLDQLVEMGYLRKFTTQPYRNNPTRNWRYRQMVKNVCFGLTAKGKEVAPQYLAIYDNEEKLHNAHVKAKYWYEKRKDTEYARTYEEWFEMAMDGQL